MTRPTWPAKAPPISACACANSASKANTNWGPRRGHIDGRPQNYGRIVFSFEGMDGPDLVNGAGLAWLEGACLHFQLLYHFGDDFAFSALPPAHG